MEEISDRYAQIFEELSEDKKNIVKEMQTKTAETIDQILQGRNHQYQQNYLNKSQIIRILIARQFIIENALVMWKNWVEWRINLSIDNINPHEIEQNILTGLGYWHGQDKQGNPCIIVRVARHIAGQIPAELTVRYATYLMEKGLQLAQKSTEKVCVIYDRTGFTQKNADQQFTDLLRKTITMYQDNYAERLRCVYVLNASWIMKFSFSMAKPFMAKKTLEQFKLIDQHSDLLQYFEKDQLQKVYGGTSSYEHDPKLELSEGIQLYKQKLELLTEKQISKISNTTFHSFGTVDKELFDNEADEIVTQFFDFHNEAIIEFQSKQIQPSTFCCSSQQMQIQSCQIF